MVEAYRILVSAPVPFVFNRVGLELGWAGLGLGLGGLGTRGTRVWVGIGLGWVGIGPGGFGD